MKQTKSVVKLILLSIFLVLSVLSFFFLQDNRENNEQQHLQLISKRYQSAYNTIYEQYKQLAKNIHSEFFERYALQDLYQQLLTADIEKKKILRAELLAEIKPRYDYLSRELHLKHLHFHLPGNGSFLRMHRPEKFGDSLTGVRETVEYVNREHRAIGGFEEGRQYSGYRFVFPITAADMKHLGSMEVSFGPEALVLSLMKQYDILSNFLIKEEVSNRKVFPGEVDEVYTKSHHKGYLFDKNVLAALQMVSQREWRALQPEKAVIDTIDKNAHQSESLSLYDPVLNVVFTTIPVVNPVTGEMNAFLTIRSSTNYFAQEARHFRTMLLLSMFLLALMLFVTYLYYSRRKILTDLNESLEERVAKRTQQLQASKDEWENTFDAIPDIITLQDRDMKIIRANQAAFDYFQMDHMELLGSHCYSLFRCKSEPCAGCPGLLSFSDTRKHHSIKEHDYLGRIFQVSSAPVFSQGNKVQYIVNVAQDITEKKQLEKELHQAQKMEAIGTLAGGIAHDFNNILSAILGYAELIKPEISKDSDESLYISRIITAGKRAGELVKQILAFSHANTQKRKAHRMDIVVKEALKMLRSSLPSTISVQTHFELKNGLILADPTKIYQVVVNLCVNASHAIGKENGTINVRLGQTEVGPKTLIGKTGVEAGVFVVLTVEDSGKGMRKEILERIFDPYFTTKKQGEGSGLGLAVSRGIIDKCGGFVTVESVLGEGTVFQIFLPSVQENCGDTKLSESPVALPTGRERILLVDDEPDLVTIGSSLLARLGYHVTSEVNSAAALATFRAQPDSFDLLITDQTMPDLTGDELAKTVLKIKPAIPIILITGYSASLSPEEAYGLGIKKFMVKPVSEKDLAETVREILDEC